MHFNDYQECARRSDQYPRKKPIADSYKLPTMTIPLFGLVGEAGQLLSEYKKHLRRDRGYNLSNERVKEELGDLLWYLSNVATKFDLSLDEVASFNLAKTGQRWLGATTDATEYELLDESFPPEEQFPRRGEITLNLNDSGQAQMWYEGCRLGASLTDNRYEPDEYRFHDAFHLACMATLGWSPVIRSLLGRKRRSVPEVDEVEDGGRAIIVDETLSNLIFLHAEERDFSVENGMDWEVLRTIKNLTDQLEVSVRSEGDWQRAVVCGFQAWKSLREARGGALRFDLFERSLTFVELRS